MTEELQVACSGQTAACAHSTFAEAVAAGPSGSAWSESEERPGSTEQILDSHNTQKSPSRSVKASQALLKHTYCLNKFQKGLL